MAASSKHVKYVRSTYNTVSSKLAPVNIVNTMDISGYG
jgi:hypothetical protein